MSNYQSAEQQCCLTHPALVKVLLSSSLPASAAVHLSTAGILVAVNGISLRFSVYFLNDIIYMPFYMLIGHLYTLFLKMWRY